MALVATDKDDILTARRLKHWAAVRREFKTVAYIKEMLETDQLLGAAQAWFELDRDTQFALYGLSTTNGGVWTTKERDLIHNHLLTVLRESA